MNEQGRPRPMALGVPLYDAAAAKEVALRGGSFLLAVGIALTLVPALMLVPGLAGAEPKRSPWEADRVAELATRLFDQAQRLEVHTPPDPLGRIK